MTRQGRLWLASWGWQARESKGGARKEWVWTDGEKGGWIEVRMDLSAERLRRSLIQTLSGSL